MTVAASQARLVELMRELQFTATETRLYLALLEESPATGYELAARSGVPRSAIYSTLKKMEGRGIVLPVQQNPARYAPLPPEQLCERLQQRYSNSIDELKAGFAAVPRAGSTAALWQVHGFEAVLNEAVEQISGAAHSIHVSLWKREAEKLLPALEKAAARGVDVRVFGFTKLPETTVDVYSCGIDESSLEHYWPHRLLLVVDRQVLLVGELDDPQKAYAVVTKEPAIVGMGANNLILDLTLFGQRFEVDISKAISGLQDQLAPIDALLAKVTL